MNGWELDPRKIMLAIMAILLIPIVLFVIGMFISVIQGEQLIPIIIEVVPEMALLASCGF